MEEIGKLLLGVLGVFARLWVRLPKTHQNEAYSAVRCSLVYLRLAMLTLYFTSGYSDNISLKLSFAHAFLFPFHYLMANLDEGSKKSFLVLILINSLCLFTYFILKRLCSTLIRLKYAYFVMEIIYPDILVYLIYDFMQSGAFELYTQSLGFVITLSFNATVVIGGPLFTYNSIITDNEALFLYTGLKFIRYRWYELIRHLVIKIQEFLMLLLQYFNTLWLKDNDLAVKTMQKSTLTSILLFICLRLQKAHWAFLHKSANVFMERAYSCLIISAFTSQGLYTLPVLLYPFNPYLTAILH